MSALAINPNAEPDSRAVDVIDPNAPPPPAGDKYGATVPVVDAVWTADQAKKVVLGDFNLASADRTSHESRWQEAAILYLAESNGTRFWEGTKTPRSNLQVHQCFQQVNALRPQIVDTICGGDLDFDVEPANSGTTIGQAQMVRLLMQDQIRSLGGRVKFR